MVKRWEVGGKHWVPKEPSWVDKLLRSPDELDPYADTPDDEIRAATSSLDAPNLDDVGNGNSSNHMTREGMKTQPGGDKLTRAIDASRSGSVSDETVRVTSVPSETAEVPATGYPAVPDGEDDPRVDIIREYEANQPEGEGGILTHEEILRAADLVNRSASKSEEGQ